MRQGWRSVPLGELLNIQSGFAFSSKEFSETEGTPLIRIRDLKNGHHTSKKFNGHYDPSYLVGACDLLIGMDGEFVCYEWQGEPALLNQRVCRLIDFSNELLPRYLHYGVNKHLKEIEDVTTFTTVKHISTKKIKAIQFSLPPLPEQRRIVAILDEAFQGIDRAVANTEKNLANARELFESYLDAVFSESGDDWEETKIGDIFETVTGGTPPKREKHLYGDYLPFVKPPELIDGPISSAADGLSQEGAEVARVLPPNSILVSCIGNLGKIGINILPVAFNQQINAIKPHHEVAEPLFLFYQTLSPKFSDNLARLASGTTVPIVNKSKFNSIPILLPPLPEQKRIVAILDELKANSTGLVCAARRKLDLLAGLKQSIPHKAFAGELTADRVLAEPAFAEAGA